MIRLVPLTYEEMLILIEKLAEIHAVLFDYERTITQEELICFIKIEFGRVGADSNITPREIIRDFIELLDILLQNPSLSVAELLNASDFPFSAASGDASVPEAFAEFTL